MLYLSLFLLLNDDLNVFLTTVIKMKMLVFSLSFSLSSLLSIHLITALLNLKK